VRILNPGIDLGTSRSAVQLAAAYTEVYAAVGVHPNSAMEWNQNSLSELRYLVKHPKVVAIGEIGLDYYRDRATRDVQKKVLLEQLALAAEENLPVVIHNRQATDDILTILTEWYSEIFVNGYDVDRLIGVMHSYADTVDSIDKVMSLNFMIGITGPVTFRNALMLREVVSTVPVDRLLIETDAPFLTPHPWRGQRNEPSYVVKTAEKMAEIKKMPLDRIAHITTANADRLFHWRGNF
jgi:TatD DNase family protein